MKTTKQYASESSDDSTIETGDALKNNMEEEMKRRCEEVNTTTNMTHNSCKAWNTIINLSNDPASTNPPCLESANKVAHHLLING